MNFIRLHKIELILSLIFGLLAFGIGYISYKNIYNSRLENSIDNSINILKQDLSTPYFQSGLNAIQKLADKKDYEWIDAIEIEQEDKTVLNTIIAQTKKEVEGIRFIEILNKDGKGILKTENLFAHIRNQKPVADFEKSHVSAALLSPDSELIVIFTTDILFHNDKIGQIYLGMSSRIPPPLHEIHQYGGAKLVGGIAGSLIALLSFAAMLLIRKFVPVLSKKLAENKQKAELAKLQKLAEAEKKAAEKERDLLRTPKTPVPKFYAQIGDYKLIRKLGEGGMAEVFMAKRVEGNLQKRKYTVKIIKPDLNLSPEDEETINRLFKREAELGEIAEHPNIIRIEDYLKEHGIQAIVMEYIDGKDLAQIIRMLKEKKETLSINQLLFISTEICLGLRYIHSNNIVHRDIKPSNILISFKGEVKISDFGISKFSDSAATLIMGTPSYMAPEQLGDEKMDHRSDLYSLGLIMYEIISGKTIQEIDPVMRKTLVKIKPLIELKPDIPPNLNDVIMKCVEKDKDFRYKNIEELYKELKSLNYEGKDWYSAIDLQEFMETHFKKTTDDTTSDIKVPVPK